MHRVMLALTFVVVSALAVSVNSDGALERFARVDPHAVAHAVEAAQGKARAVLDSHASRGRAADGLEGDSSPIQCEYKCLNADSLSEKGLINGVIKLLG